jgi:choline-glycine betaine transporter
MKSTLKTSLLFFVFMAFAAVDVKNPAPGLFSTSICDPVLGCTVKGIIGSVVSLLLGLSGLIAMLFIIIGGYQYLTSGANEELAKTGKKTLTNAIIGLVIIIMSYVIIYITLGTLGVTK